MIVAYIRMHNLYSSLEKTAGIYTRTTQHGPGQRKIRETVSDLTAARLCSLGDWSVCDKLVEAKMASHPYQALLAKLDEL